MAVRRSDLGALARATTISSTSAPLTTSTSVIRQNATPQPASSGDDGNGVSAGASIVITCYTERRWRSLLKAIDSARAQTYPSAVIVVVDHNDALLHRLRAEIPGDVLVVPNEFEVGVSGSRNTGAFKAGTDYVAFLDDDASAAPSWIERLISAMGFGQAIGAGAEIIAQWDDQPTWFPDEFGWVVGVTSHSNHTKTTAVRNVWANGMLVKAAHFEGVGGFRTGFGKLGTTSEPEDTELCLRMTRASRAGAEWLFVPEVELYHEIPAERQTVGYFAQRCWDEGVGKAALLRTGTPAALALSEESTYARTLLVKAFWRYVGSAVLGRGGQVGKAAALLLGFWVTVGGFAFGRLRLFRFSHTKLEHNS